jgi:hypothetical protein
MFVETLMVKQQHYLRRCNYERRCSNYSDAVTTAKILHGTNDSAADIATDAVQQAKIRRC